METVAAAQCPHVIAAHFSGKFGHDFRNSTSLFAYNKVQFPRINLHPISTSSNGFKGLVGRIYSLPDFNDIFGEKVPTPILDLIKNPIHLKNLSLKELKQLAGEIRSELSSILPKTEKAYKASLAVAELTVAIHHVFHAPVDKILWDAGEHTYVHKILTGRRSLMCTLRQKNGLSGFTTRSESEYDPFGAGHGCNSISAGLGMAIARDIKGKRERIVTVISNKTTLAGQVYEAMGNAGYLDPNMIVILNDSRHSLHPKIEEGLKTPINALSSTLSRIQSSKSFRMFREVAKGVTKRMGGGMHELAAKFDEYARGMMGPQGSTLFEELGLYYIGPVDGHNIDDLVCVLQEVASLDSMGPVLVHVITEENQGVEYKQKSNAMENHQEGLCKLDSLLYSIDTRTYSDCFVEALVMQAEEDKDIVAVHAGMEMEPSLQLFQEKFPEKYFDVGMAEQHAVTFSAGLSCGGLKPFCIIPSAFLQRAYDQVLLSLLLHPPPTP
uniref:Transketolase-like pyrimidine-binding domain-containing protein n=1 Tax=Rhizophora mucronata TaxID=61149 RepID=A0A2P2KJ13_RHIMU